MLALHDASLEGHPISLHSVIDERAAGSTHWASRARPINRSSCRAPPARRPPTTSGHRRGIRGHGSAVCRDGGPPARAPGLRASGHEPGGTLRSHVRADLNVEAPEPEDNPQHFVHALRRLWTAVTGIAPGPVHVNLRFRKPLWRADSPDVETPPVSPTEPRPYWPPRPTSNVCATPGATAASSWLDPTPDTPRP